ncbi:MAG TPA: acyl-CoA dehydrogenase family protein [Xanthobacteraceae bacterium]|nr:acyl-CoA dehydrogenase family protein [Xanthobacteraceae bacterium]
MDFALSDDQRLLLGEWRKAIDRDIAPVTKQHLDSFIPKETASALLKKTGEFGIGNGWVPEEGGGLGLDFLTSGLLYEELSRTSPDLAGLAFVAEGAALKLFRTGSEEMKARYLPGLLSGDLIGCSAISEPGIGSSVREMRTKAVRDGKNYRISGEKLWISNASIADLTILVAKTGEQEFTMFLVDREQHGFKTVEISKLGLNGWSLGQIVLEDVLVPEENILGGLGGGLRETMKGFERSRCFISTLALGIAQASLDESLKYVKERHAFGKPIGGHQLVQGLLAEMVSDIDASRLLLYRALWMLSSGDRCTQEAAVAKSFVTEAAQRVTSKAVQIHGAFGISKEFPLERHFRNARMLTLPDGTTQINHLIIGRSLTGIDAFK